MTDPLVSTRVDPRLLQELDSLAERRDQPRSVLLRHLLEEGLAEARLEEALEAYRRGEASFWRAAELADVPVRRLLEELRERRLPLPRGYSLEDAAEDLDQAKGSRGA